MDSSDCRLVVELFDKHQLISRVQIIFASAMVGVVATKLKVAVANTDCLLNLDGDVCTYVDVCLSYMVLS